MVAIYLAQQQLRAGRDLDIYNLVHQLREQRSQSVQTASQYLYVYNVILRWVWVDSVIFFLDQIKIS